MPEKADDAAGLSPSKEDNAFWRNSDRKEGEIFIKRLYQTSPNNSAKSFCAVCAIGAIIRPRVGCRKYCTYRTPLGFDKYWNYAKNDTYPYRGRLVAKTKGGSMCTAPEIIIVDEPESNGMPLRFVDIPAMVEKNRDLLEKLAAETINKG